MAYNYEPETWETTLKKLNSGIELSEREKEFVLSTSVTPKLEQYLQELLQNLTIQTNAKRWWRGNIENGYLIGNCWELTYDENSPLEGWCYQTTEEAILFFPDDADAYIERSEISLNENHTKYRHAYICFKFYEVEYVYDPALGLLGLKDLYDKLYQPNIFSKTTATDVKKAFIKQLKNKIEQYKSPEYSWLENSIQQYFNKLSEDESAYPEPPDIQIGISCDDRDVNSPLYGLGAICKEIRWTGSIENPKILKLCVEHDFGC